MKTVDFLPPELVWQSEARVQRYWWLVVCVAFGGFIVVAASLQTLRRWGLQREMAHVEPLCQAAAQMDQQLAESQKKLDRANLHAALIAGLECDWPRTVVISEVLIGLPQDTQLTAMRIHAETQVTPTNPRSTDTVQVITSESPNSNDTLREDYDQFADRAKSRRLILELAGITRAPAELHHYASQLATRSLVADATLKTLEAVESSSDGEMRFVILVTVRPGAGQPGGPSLPSSSQREPAPQQASRPESQVAWSSASSFRSLPLSWSVDSP